MRKVYDTNGNDVTTSVAAFLGSNRTLYQCDLMMMSSWIWWEANASWADNYSAVNPQFMNFYWSFGDFPVDVGYVQTGPNQVTPITKWGPLNEIATFMPAPMQRDKFEYDIGFSAKTTEVTWYCGSSLLPLPVQSTDAPWFNTGGLNSGWPRTGLFFSGATTAVPVIAGKRLFIRRDAGAVQVSFPNAYCDGLGLRATDSGLGANNGALVAAFTDSTGEMVAPPFLIGNGIAVNVPPGATQIQMGINDGPVEDNFGQFMVSVSGSGVFAAGPYPTWQQGFSSGMFDECPVYMYRAFFNGDPKQGGTLLGTTLMFRGFVRESESAQDHVKITLSSLLDLFQDIQVPTQLIQPGNRTTPYVPSGVTYTVNGVNVGLSTPLVLALNNTLGSPPADHALQDAYIITGGVTSFTPVNGQPQPPCLRIRDNVTTAGVLYIYLYEPTVIPLTALAVEYYHGTGLGSKAWQTQPATLGILLQKPISNSYGAPGFPYVPAPEIGI